VLAEVYVVYLAGQKAQPITAGSSPLVSLASGWPKIDMLVAPWRLFRFVRKNKINVYITSDLIFSWWYALGLKLLTRHRLILIPVCMPEQIYQSTHKSLSGLPIWLERIFTRFSFALADVVATGRNIKTYINWLSADKKGCQKLKIVDVLVDELPTWEFFTALSKPIGMGKKTEPVLLYVGRLHREKMVADIIQSLAIIQRQGIKARLWLIGAGPEQNALQELSQKLGLAGYVEFLGAKKNEELVSYYRQASVFISTLTGTALREAALCQLPVVAYKMDWIEGLLVDEQNALLTEPGNIEALAKTVIRLLQDQPLADKLAVKFHEYAVKTWSNESVKKSIEQLLI
ncbi:MAG: glycosyltransferase family 4 protein, partial [bacterium]|nr:glycosyltransferase family 4 protein [bacterium]